MYNNFIKIPLKNLLGLLTPNPTIERKSESFDNSIRATRVGKSKVEILNLRFSLYFLSLCIEIGLDSGSD